MWGTSSKILCAAAAADAMARDREPPVNSCQLRRQAAGGGGGGVISGQADTPTVQSWISEAASSEPLLLHERARPEWRDRMRKWVMRSDVTSLPPPCSQICRSMRADASNSQRRARRKAQYLANVSRDVNRWLASVAARKQRALARTICSWRRGRWHHECAARHRPSAAA